MIKSAVSVLISHFGYINIAWAFILAKICRYRCLGWKASMKANFIILISLTPLLTIMPRHRYPQTLMPRQYNFLEITRASYIHVLGVESSWWSPFRWYFRSDMSRRRISPLWAKWQSVSLLYIKRNIFTLHEYLFTMMATVGDGRPARSKGEVLSPPGFPAPYQRHIMRQRGISKSIKLEIMSLTIQHSWAASRWA